MDVAGAAVLLILLAPVLAFVAIAVRLDSAGPVLHRTDRVGYRGAQLALIKFRKMRPNAHTLPLTVAADERLTRVGSVLTRTRLDELPQLWHVLRGEMSFVGPRPEDPRFVALHAAAYDTILSVRPGITGWTQLMFADERALLASGDAVATYVEELLPRKVELDLAYAQSWTLGGDVGVLLWTPLVVLRELTRNAPLATRASKLRARYGSAPDVEEGRAHARTQP